MNEPLYKTWMSDASCATVAPDIMFPNLERETEVRTAKKVCAGCPLATQSACLAQAIVTGDKYSVSGGLTPKERKRWSRDRRPRNTAEA